MLSGKKLDAGLRFHIGSDIIWLSPFPLETEVGIPFIGLLINALKNILVIQFGIIACALALPALIAGQIRGIP